MSRRSRRSQKEQIKLTIAERNLGRHKALGLCYQGENYIELDPRQEPKEFLDTLST